MEKAEPYPLEVMGKLGDEIYQQDIKHLVEPPSEICPILTNLH